jgi:hypothetical protein
MPLRRALAAQLPPTAPPQQPAIPAARPSYSLSPLRPLTPRPLTPQPLNPPPRPCRDQQDAAVQAQSNQQFYLQFVTKYLHWSGELRCRVTTVTRRWTAAGAGDLIQVRCAQPAFAAAGPPPARAACGALSAPAAPRLDA